MWALSVFAGAGETCSIEMQLSQVPVLVVLLLTKSPTCCHTDVNSGTVPGEMVYSHVQYKKVACMVDLLCCGGGLVDVGMTSAGCHRMHGGAYHPCCNIAVCYVLTFSSNSMSTATSPLPVGSVFNNILCIMHRLHTRLVPSGNHAVPQAAVQQLECWAE